MSQDIDFIIPEIKKIEKPIKPNNLQDKKKHGLKTFQIKKSFVTQPVSQIHEQLRPQVNQLKKFYKLKKQREKKEKQLAAQKSEINKREISKNGIEDTKDEQKETLRVDQSGQLRDKYNNLVFVKTQKTQLKINQKKQLEKQAKQLGKKQRIKFHERLSKSFLDRNLILSGSKKRLRRSMLGLQFLQQGSYQPYSNKPVSNQINNDLNEVVKNETETKIIRKRFKTQLQFSRQVPNVQWWDKQIINEQKYKQFIQAKKQQNYPFNIEQIINFDKLKEQVTFQKIGDAEKKQAKINIPLYLTKDERKKLKRKKKKERLIQKNDMVRLGLIEPEKPKLKISNMAIVMKDQFIIDPSKVQSQAKRQQQQRLNKHLQANSERKLTKSQRKNKSLKKLKKDSAKQCRRIVFKLNSLQDSSQAFKVNMNAKQLALNGFILMPTQYHNQPVIVMAEGGQKAIRFFKNLMLNRIKWNEKADNICSLVWQGEIQNSKIGKWRTIEVCDQSETIRALTERGVENFRQYLA